MNNISDKQLKVEIKNEVKEEMLEMGELYFENYIDDSENNGLSELAGKLHELSLIDIPK